MTFAGKYGRAFAQELPDGLWQVEFGPAVDWYAARDEACHAALAFVARGVLPCAARPRFIVAPGGWS
jgi:hypothetical protein